MKRDEAWIYKFTGQAHVKRKLSIPDRSRSVSPHRIETPYPVYDKYQKYEKHRKGKYEKLATWKFSNFLNLQFSDSMTRYGTRWGDAGYASSSPSPIPLASKFKQKMKKGHLSKFFTGITKIPSRNYKKKNSLYEIFIRIFFLAFSKKKFRWGRLWE